MPLSIAAVESGAHSELILVLDASTWLLMLELSGLLPAAGVTAAWKAPHAEATLPARVEQS